MNKETFSWDNPLFGVIAMMVVAIFLFLVVFIPVKVSLHYGYLRKLIDKEIVQIEQEKYLERIEALTAAAQNGVEVKLSLNLNGNLSVDPVGLSKIVGGK